MTFLFKNFSQLCVGPIIQSQSSSVICDGRKSIHENCIFYVLLFDYNKYVLLL